MLQMKENRMNSNFNQYRLNKACSEQDLATVKKLIACNINVNVNFIDNLGRTAIMYAAEAGSTEIIKFLIDKHAIFTTLKDDEGKTALWFAAAKGDINSVATLLAHGANLSVGYKLFDPLWIAAANGHAEVVDLFLQNKLYRSSEEHNFNSALDIAKKNEHFKIVNMLNKYLILNFTPYDTIKTLQILASKYYETKLNNSKMDKINKPNKFKY